MTSIVSTEHLEDLARAIEHLKAQDTASALEVVESILKKDPQVPEALHLLGLVSLLLNDPGRALELMTAAHNLDPDCRDYVDALASLHAQTGDLNTSLYFGKLATVLEPHPELSELTPSSLQNYADALNQARLPSLLIEAQLFFNRRDFAKAALNCEKQLRITPNDVEALRLLGKSLVETGEYKRAEVALHAAEQLEPDDLDTQIDLGRCLVLMGKNADALACFDHACGLDEDDVAPLAQRIHALSFMDTPNWETRSQTDDAFLKRATALGIELFEGGDQPPQGKIRIGLISDKFYNCDEGLVLETFSRNLDRSKFELFCLQQSITNDKVTDRFKATADSWRPIFDVDDWALASIISGDGIQALIDTTGFTAGNRKTSLSARPAPLQVAWLNHLDGTGKDIIDLVLSDNATIEVDHRSMLEGQDVAKLHSGLFAFPPFAMTGEVAALPALEHDTITFGAYADPARVTPSVAKVWCDILRSVPRSLLALNVQPQLTEDAQAALSERFAHFGMSKRVAFVSNTAAERDEDASGAADPEHEFLKNTDILLDAPAHSSPGKVAMALWMGVPVLTFNPGRRSGLVAASILDSAGKGEWVAQTPQELVTLAQNLTRDYAALSDIRASLRDDIRDSALFQGRDFAREIEAAIEMALEDKGII